MGGGTSLRDQGAICTSWAMINLAELVTHLRVRTLPWKMPALQTWGHLFHLLFLHRTFITHEVKSSAEGLGKFSGGFHPLFPASPGLLRAPWKTVPHGGLSGLGFVGGGVSVSVCVSVFGRVLRKWP